MSRRRKKKIVRPIHLSSGPLPWRLADGFAGRVLVFSDASLKRHGGLAAVMFAGPDAEPQVATRTVAVTGSNELELRAALFALAAARQVFPEAPLALFSDNQDAVSRLQRGQGDGLASDDELARMLDEQGIAATLAAAAIVWIKGHGTCRGNSLADRHAAGAAA